MISLDDIRATIVSEFKSVHEANYPDMLVNYPNFVVVDTDVQLDPFVSVGVYFDHVDQAVLGDSELDVTGRLAVSYYFRQGTGTQGAYKYTDMLNANLVVRKIGSLWVSPVKPFNISTYPGWNGVLNSMRFVYTN